MHLKSLEIQGFKSFPDKTIITFGEDITAIVGPNGSGKSNISDAILWVMGEMSTKTLRGAKMEDVIFGGTQKRAPLGFAEATLTLDNSDRALAYDADTVQVTRRYYRSGDSEYYINRQSARLKDINEMFMDTGLGREGYSNVSQGRIDEILSRKSTERREIFEEAAGISKYRHRKEETQRKLLTTEDNLTRIGDKISELELQIGPLQQQAEKAQKYLVFKDELRGLEVTVCLETLTKLSAAAKKAEEDFASASFVLEQAHEALTELYRKTEQLTEDLRVQDIRLEEVRAQVSAKEAAGQQLEGQESLLKANLANNEENMERIRQEMRQQADRTADLDSQIGALCQRMAELEEEIQGQQAQLNQTQAQAQVLSAGAQGLTKRFLDLRNQQSDLSAQISAAQAELAAIAEAIAQNGRRLQQLNEDLSSGSRRRQEARTALDQCRAKLEKAQREVTSAKNTISGYQLRAGSRKNKCDELQARYTGVQQQLQAVTTKAQLYRTMERDFENFNRSVKTVMQEAKRGGLRNICGPVSMLIKTDDAYTAAIEIALGAAMQQIVVETENDGKAAIQFLKRTGAGRATFLPISVIEGKRLQESGLERCRGFVGIASELVRCDAKYRRIVDNLLGRTVITEDLDAAVAMAKTYRNRFKIVSLDGQVVNPGGSMTGGSMSKETGILSRANELEKLTAREGELKKQQQELLTQLQEAQRALSETQYQIQTASESLRQAEDAVLRLQGEEKQHAILLQAIEDAAAGAEAQRRELQERNEADRRREAVQNERIAGKQQLLSAVTRDLESLTLEQNDTTQAAQNLTDAMAQLRATIAALEAERNTNAASRDHLEQLRSSMVGDNARKQALLDSYEGENRKISGELDRVGRAREENLKGQSQLREKLADVQKERMDIEATKTRSERDAQEKNKDILTMERTCALLEQKKITTAMEERQISDQLWDNYALTPGTAQSERVEIESMAAANRKISELKRKISTLGTPNLGAIDEYARISERYNYLTGQRDDVLTAKRELESIIGSITAEMTMIFTSEFAKINRYFGETFVEMFRGGKGELVLEDPEDPLNCGIEIKVQPPGKQLKTITLLSGGEKAFVAIALYFAILKVRPTPFCMLDEIDAALDDRNVERFASYLSNLSDKTQFIVITHRRGTMEEADMLYGVTMQEQGVSKILPLNLNEMEQHLGIVE